MEVFITGNIYSSVSTVLVAMTIYVNSSVPTSEVAVTHTIFSRNGNGQYWHFIQ